MYSQPRSGVLWKVKIAPGRLHPAAAGRPRSGQAPLRICPDETSRRPPRATVVRHTRSLHPDLYHELRRIGVHLNQAVRKLHGFAITGAPLS
jgi:hypothetical protein